MTIIMICCEGAIQLVNIDFNYSETLKETIIETLTCVLHGINQRELNKSFEAYIPNIFTFIRLSTDKSVRPTVKYISICLSLLADFSNIYSELIKPQLDHENLAFISVIYRDLVRNNRDNQYTRILKYAK